VNTVYGRRIRQARRIRGLSVSFVAGKIDIRQPRLSELEHSYVADISEQLIAKLSSVLDFPEPFFSVEPIEAFHLGSLLFRAKSTLTFADAEQLAEYAIATGEIFSALSEFASSPSIRLPELRLGASPAEAAEIVRQQFSLGPEEPIDNLTRKAERAGVLAINLAFEAKLHSRLDAFSCWVGDYIERPIVVLRSSASWERLRWSLAHELGHAVLHRRQRDGDIEDEANQFANELLVPSAVLNVEWPRNPTLMSLLPMKEKWGISLQALIQHGYYAGLMDDYRRMSLYKQLSNRKWPDGVRWREREPAHNSRDVELPRMLGKMVEVGLGAGIGLDVVSESTGYWPVLMLQQLLGVQLLRPYENVKGRSPGAANSRPGQIVSLADRRRPGPAEAAEILR
jgi:Zn-dependent peptidase ImmA (M78 family)